VVCQVEHDFDLQSYSLFDDDLTITSFLFFSAFSKSVLRSVKFVCVSLNESQGVPVSLFFKTKLQSADWGLENRSRLQSGRIVLIYFIPQCDSIVFFLTKCTIFYL